MVHREPMGVELAPRTGPSTQAGAVAYHRVCESSVRNQRAAVPHLWIWQADGCYRLQSRPFLGAGLHAPARWHAALSCQSAAFCPIAVPRSRWQPARGVWSQYSQLPPLSITKASPMEWRGNGKAAPGERPAPSGDGWFCSAPLAGLESQDSPTRLHPSAPPPAHRGPGRARKWPDHCPSCAALPC